MKENRMKKLATLIFALLLSASLSFAQAATGSSGTQTDTKTEKKSGKKHHKGGKKSKKGQTGSATPPPK
jgi:Spy/CpxP family protein refolding chaperone